MQHINQNLSGASLLAKSSLGQTLEAAIFALRSGSSAILGAAGNPIASQVFAPRFSSLSNLPSLSPGKIFVGNSSGLAVEGQTVTVDEANGRLGINNPNPEFDLDNVNDGGDAYALMTSYGALAAGFITRVARGSLAIPSATLLGDFLGFLGGAGWSAAGFPASSRGGVLVEAAEDWSNTEQGTRVKFLTTPIGGTAAVYGASVEPDGSLLTSGRKQAVAIKSGNYTLTVNDEIVVFTVTATGSLPAATGSGNTHRIICRAGTTTIDGNSTDTVKGELTQTLTAGEDLIITDTAVGIWE